MVDPVEASNLEESILPCERPSEIAWDQGALVFGESGNQDKRRSSSTSVNRVEFPDLSSTLPSIPSADNSIAMPWDEGAYTAYKLNCHKKKRKVENMINLYDKDSVNSLEDRNIYKQKLDEISAAALEAVMYVDDLVDQLEEGEEEARATELLNIKSKILDLVKKNEREVKAEMQSIIERSGANSDSATPNQLESNPITAADLQQALASISVNSAVAPPDPVISTQARINKINLKKNHLQEDTLEFMAVLNKIKSPVEMSDSDIIYHMKLIRTWEKKLGDIVSELRKLEVEALGLTEVAAIVEALATEVQSAKGLEKEKVDALTAEDEKRGLNSLCEYKNRDTVVFPEPFKGVFGENVYKFRDEVKAAIRDSQIKKADQVKTLIKYLRGDAKLRVGEHQPDLDTALATLVNFYGNTNLIWLKCKQSFELTFKGDPSRTWGDLGSAKRVDMIAKVLEFIRQANQYSTDYPELKEEILSSQTVSLLTRIMPLDYIERVYLAMDTVTASPTDKIKKIEEILGKLKTCAILAVNQLGGSKSDKMKYTSDASRNPLGLTMSGTSVCTVSTSHECQKSSKCQPSWGLLGCCEIYKLKTVEERITYCKESNCCYICGNGDLSESEKSDQKHKRCNYKSPTDRFLTKCTAWRSKNSQGRKLYCFYGAALCPDHQGIPNTSSQLIEWLKDKKIRHDMFTLSPACNKVSKGKAKLNRTKQKNEPVSDDEALDLLKSEMKNCSFENGDIAEIPSGENMFMFFLMQGRRGTDPIQVFCDSGANFFFAVESVTKKLVCVQTYKGSLPINVAGGKVVYSTGEWVAAIPLDDGSFQAVRGLTMRSVVGQMPRFDLRRTLEGVQAEYKENSLLQSLNIPPMLGGTIDMIIGSKYLKIYPETVQVTPSGLTVSMSRLRTPDGCKTAVISGPVKFINQIFQTKYAKDCVDSMKAMLVHASSYSPVLEYFPNSSHLECMADSDIPGLEQLCSSVDCDDYDPQSNMSGIVSCSSSAVCEVTVQGELQRFMDMQESGLKTEFRCRQCRTCLECKRGAGHEKLSLRQEAEQELIRESIFINEEEGYAVAKLPFTLPPEENLKSNRHIALKMLDRILKKYCSDLKQRECVASAWDKMISNKHLVLVSDLSKEQQDMLAKAHVSYWIPWNLQFKESLSTPIRPVFNGSSQTSTGMSLNDCLAKGSPDLVKLLSVMLEWQMGKSAVCGDISQFYPTIKLKPEHWQYQRILLRKDLDPCGEIVEAVMVKLIFGIQSVSSQCEETVRRMAKGLWEELPHVANLLINSRYVDDIAKSTNSEQESMKLTSDTTSVLKSKLDMSIKGWSVAGKPPPQEVTKDGISVDLGGHIWFTEADLFTINIPPICLVKKQRGKLPDGVFAFDPKAMNLAEYVPECLSRRMVTSTVSKIWDPLGKTAPVTLRLKQDLRNLIRESPEWDATISLDARSLWIQNFDIITKLREFVYVRNSRPSDALRQTCRLWIVVDAAEWGMMLAVYAGWERPNGVYSCSHLFGKGLLGPEQLTLPQKELHVLSVGADVFELMCNVLDGWIEEILVGSDSEIALCWTLYESIKLNQYNRVRAINIVSKINLQDLYHVIGSENPADIGTRSKMISADDVMPGSVYLCGKPWMKLKKEDAVKAGIIKSVNDIKLGHEQKRVMKKGIVFDSFEQEDQTILATLVTARMDVKKVAERELEALYPFSPLLRNFLSFVDITALVIKPVKLLKKMRLKKTGCEVSNNEIATPKFSISAYYSEQVVKQPPNAVVTDLDRSDALEFIFRTESKIVKKFIPKRKLDKIAFEEDGILYCKSRVLEGQTVKIVGGLNIDTSLKGLFNLNFKVPIIEQHSPLAFPLALHLHSLFNHRGDETCYRLSLNYVRILGGKQIFKSISANCVTCQKDRKKYLKMIMGGLADTQLYVSPVFYYVLCDMWGPFKSYCPGYERQTRRDKAYDTYFLIFACVTTGAVNVQLLEGKTTEFVLEGCSRFFSECSVPKILYPDDDGALQKAFSKGEIDVVDLSGRLFKSKGIHFETCPPQAHSAHGRVERVIRSMKDCFSRSGASSSRLTATGWLTIGKGLERVVNDTPIGFLYDKSSSEGNPLLRVLKPSSLKGIHASDRAPSGLFSIPEEVGSHFAKVQEAYELWYRCWATSYVPLIAERQKWTEEDVNLQVNDIVYFMLEEKVKITWRVGKVDSVKVGRDNKVREVNIAYKILKEDTWSHSVVTRPTRKIVKLFELNDTTFAEDVKEVHKVVKELLLKRGSIEEFSGGVTPCAEIAQLHLPSGNTAAFQAAGKSCSTEAVNLIAPCAKGLSDCVKNSENNFAFLQSLRVDSWQQIGKMNADEIAYTGESSFGKEFGNTGDTADELLLLM